MGAIKVYPADHWFSLCVRMRPAPGFSCEVCDKQFAEGSTRGLHCSHLFSRRNKSVRWNGSNAFSHCYACHQRLGGNPVDFTDWARNQLGDTVYDQVREASRQPYKGWKKDLKDIRDHYKAEFERMKELRDGGDVDWIEFISWS